MKAAIVKTYGRKGEVVVKMNQAAVDAGIDNVYELKVPDSWKTASGSSDKAPLDGGRPELTAYLNNIMGPVNAMRGNDLPVSKIRRHCSGQQPQRHRRL